MFDSPQDTFKINIKCFIQRLSTNVFYKHILTCNSSIVDNNVKYAKLCDGSIHKILDLIFLRHIGFHIYTSSFFGDIACILNISHHYFRSRLGESHGSCFTKP